jgi:hypothetical protein
MMALPARFTAVGLLLTVLQGHCVLRGAAYQHRRALTSLTRVFVNFFK